MPETWAISGVDLHLPPLGRGARVGLERALRDAVRTGRLLPGIRLPSSRTLGADLGIARNTVAEAYTQLVAEGWLTARQGSGTRVAERPAAVTDPSGARPAPDGTPSPPRGGPPDRAPSGTPDLTPQATPAPTAHGTPAPVGASSEAPVPRGATRFDLRAGVPALSEFPRADWLAAARRVMVRAQHDVLGYGDPGGRPELREALAGYLSRARGVLVRPETVVVCAGYLHGLCMLASALREAGARTVAVERYGHAAHRVLLSSEGLKVQPIRVDDLGADLGADVCPGPDATTAPVHGPVSAGRHPAAAILTPAHQFPLGVTLAADRRAAALRWATEHDALLVEDDYDGEYRYDRQPVGALQALDPEHVVYAGTASKSLAPGLRLAWLVLPRRMREPILEGQALRGGSPPALDQLTLAEFIVTGRYDRQIRRTRLLYRRRRDTMVAALQREVPAVHVTGIAAGMHAVLRLPDGASEAAVVHAAARHGVLVEGLSTYRASPADDDPPALVVGYGTPTGHAFSGAVARLCAALVTALG